MTGTRTTRSLPVGVSNANVDAWGWHIRIIGLSALLTSLKGVIVDTKAKCFDVPALGLKERANLDWGLADGFEPVAFYVCVFCVWGSAFCQGRYFSFVSVVVDCSRIFSYT